MLRSSGLCSWSATLYKANICRALVLWGSVVGGLMADAAITQSRLTTGPDNHLLEVHLTLFSDRSLSWNSLPAICTCGGGFADFTSFSGSHCPFYESHHTQDWSFIFSTFSLTISTFISSFISVFSAFKASLFIHLLSLSPSSKKLLLYFPCSHSLSPTHFLLLLFFPPSLSRSISHSLLHCLLTSSSLFQ